MAANAPSARVTPLPGRAEPLRIEATPLATNTQPSVNPAADPAFRNHGSCSPPNQVRHFATSIACAPAKVSIPIAKLDAALQHGTCHPAHPSRRMTAIVRRSSGEEAADDGDVTAIAGPAPPPLPPRARVAAALRVAAVVIVAAGPNDRAVQPMEVVAARLVGVERRHEELGQSARARRLARPGHRALLREQRLEMMRRDHLQVQPGRIRRERPAAIVRLQVFGANHHHAGHQPGQRIGKHLILLEPDGRSDGSPVQRQLADQRRPLRRNGPGVICPPGIDLSREPGDQPVRPHCFNAIDFALHVAAPAPAVAWSPHPRRDGPTPSFARPYAWRVAQSSVGLTHVRIAEGLEWRSVVRFVVAPCRAPRRCGSGASSLVRCRRIAQRRAHIADQSALRDRRVSVAEPSSSTASSAPRARSRWLLSRLELPTCFCPAGNDLDGSYLRCCRPHDDAGPCHAHGSGHQGIQPRHANHVFIVPSPHPDA